MTEEQLQALSSIVINMVKRGAESHVKETIEENMNILLADQRTQLIQAVQKEKRKIPENILEEDQYYWEGLRGYNKGLDDAIKLIEGKE